MPILINLIAPEAIANALFEQYPHYRDRILPHFTHDRKGHAAHLPDLQQPTILVSHPFSHVSPSPSARRSRQLESRTIRFSENYLILRIGPIYHPSQLNKIPKAKNAFFHGLANAPFGEFFHGLRPIPISLLVEVIYSQLNQPLPNRIITPQAVWAIARKQSLN